MKSVSPYLLAAGAIALAGPARAQTALVQNSPFATGSTPTNAVASDEPYQLTGIVASGDSARVCIYVAKAQHSRWIAVGSAANGVEVLSYDAAQKQAVISVEGAQRTLHLREVAASAAVPPAVTPEAKAREARLLTGDLLDVGLQQRQAYAKAHPPASN